ncbi:nucleotidyltransferase domain-containing protein [Thermosediminibacter litoriperuensis]|uniref:nucleotidyltransferase domain-containing protein n=1 Tax=Thermosediminibacter litoriperuensis TaxID=291989 RepID=UPI001CA3F5F1|nr:nucleotidyltransferase domain-containing protein [Thermosediminibacter litoriperuensis]
MELLNNELERMVKVLAEEYQAEKVILFGSLAEGDIHDWSDIDLIVVKETSKPFYERLEEVVEIVKPNVGTDIIVYTPKELEEMRGRLFFEEEILKKGKIIYERGKSVA